MSAPEIPNLLSLRGRGRGRGRGRHGDPSDTSEDPEAAKAKKDKIVQQTDTDASISRLSAVAAGYLDDRFAQEFAPPGETQRRLPIINRGTYARTKAIDRLVDEFLAARPDTAKQIISLGAGSDTRFFRLMDKPDPPKLVYHELDFPENTQRKLAAINESPVLRGLIGRPESMAWTDSQLHAPHYHLHAIDLRTLAQSDPSQQASGGLEHVDPALPTLLVSECCLTYLTPDAADGVVKQFASSVLAPSTPLGLVLYEPINPFDAFGRVMVSNLAARGIVLQTLHKYSSLEAQKARLRTYGLEDGQGAVDVDFLQQHWIDEEEKARIGQVEMLDEIEELVLLLRHYCVAWGWREGHESGREIWSRWKELRDQPDST